MVPGWFGSNGSRMFQDVPGTASAKASGECSELVSSSADRWGVKLTWLCLFGLSFVCLGFPTKNIVNTTIFNMKMAILGCQMFGQTMDLPVLLLSQLCRMYHVLRADLPQFLSGDICFSFAPLIHAHPKPDMKTRQKPAKNKPPEPSSPSS